MKRRTIREAAIESLKRKGKPLSAKEIYDYIIEKDLYRFNAEHPESIVRTEIRRHCEGVEFPTAKPNKFFQILKDGTYWIKDVQVPGQSNEESKSETIVRKDAESLKSIVEELDLKMAQIHYVPNVTISNVTRQRLFLETMENVLSQSNKVIVENSPGGQGVVPYLPLPAIQKPAGQ